MREAKENEMISHSFFLFLYSLARSIRCHCKYGRGLIGCIFHKKNPFPTVQLFFIFSLFSLGFSNTYIHACIHRNASRGTGRKEEKAKSECISLYVLSIHYYYYVVYKEKEHGLFVCAWWWIFHVRAK